MSIYHTIQLQGQQPDNDLVTSKSDGSAFESTSNLGAAANYTSAWVDTDGWTGIELFIATDQISATDGILIEFTDDVQAGTPTVRCSVMYTYASKDVTKGFVIYRIATLLDGFRVSYTNGAIPQTSFYLSATLRVAEVQPTSELIEGELNDSLNVSLVKAVLAGKEPDGTYTNVLLSEANAILTATYQEEVSKGNIVGHAITSKFGRNSDIDIGSTPEDVWEGGGLYTGQPIHSAAAETVVVSSSSANDTSAGTGARTIRIFGLDSNFDEIQEDITMNGTTNVTSANSYKRLFRAYVLTAGTSESNEGIINIEHSTTSANVFAAIPVDAGQTQIACYTIPNGKTGYIHSVDIAMARASGAAGSATAALMIRQEGGAWRKIRNYEITDSSPFVPPIKFPIQVIEKTDIKIHISNVSDNDTIVTADFEVELIDN